MADKILLNNKNYHIGDDDFPCLINYAEKAGGSHFSMTMAADLFRQGKKLLILTAYPMAKDNFLQQIKGDESKVAYVTSEDQLDVKFPVIILKSGNEDLYLKAIKKLDDIDDRIVFIKNIEVFSSTIFNHSLELRKIIFSGDIDRCVAKQQIRDSGLKTIIIFTQPDITLPSGPPKLEKYVGYLWSKDTEGLVKLSFKD